MALPELTLPAGTPAFSIDGHDIELVPLYADLPMQTGHGRRRRVYTSAPRSISVKLDLTLAQTLAFHEWYEGPLKAAAEWFSARVKNQGPGLLWWKARFTEPYTFEADESGVSNWITGKLLLVGVGSADSPYTPAMQAETLVALTGSVENNVSVEMSAATSVALLLLTGMHAATTVELLRVSTFILRETSGYLLREDGSKFSRE